MQHRIAAIATLAIASTVTAQDDYKAFRTTIEQSLRTHPFFSRVTLSLVERPPFLFCVERAANDEKDYEVGIVNSYLPFLREVLAQFEEHYRKPAELVRRPEAGGYALAVLSSAGRYVDFRTAIGDPSLAMMRAHYTPSLRLAVTYQDTFARHNTNPEERHALLHEFVHALQHAHAADGNMPKPVWFNEGLADYRSSSTNVAVSLRAPPLQSNHVAALAFAHANPAGRFYVAPIADLVAANSYKEVVDAATKRNGAAVPAETLLSMFYAQAEMFVRFLHEGEQGKHRAGFLRYLQAAQRGEAGVAVFEKALGVEGAAMATLDAEWMKWLDGVLRAQYPTMRDLTKGGAAAGGVVPMSPPCAFDFSGLQWTAADLAERLAGVRRVCATGDYEGSLALLPAEADVPAGEQAYLKRERARIAALIQLRDEALADLVQKKGQLATTVAGAAVRGKVLRVDGTSIVLQVGRTETPVPLAAMAPAVLVGEGRRLKRFDGKERWLEIWTRWLKGDPLPSLQSLLQLDYSTLPDLRQDLVGDCNAAYGAAGAAVLELARLPQVEEREQAAASLARLRELVQAFGKSPVFERRKQAIEKLARAYAERAFRPDDLAALGVRGAVTKGDGESVRVQYAAPNLAPNADFTPLSAKELEAVPVPDTKLTHVGPSGLLPAPEGYQLVGSAWLRWPVGLSGKQLVELDFVIRADFVPEFGVVMCATGERMLVVYPTGSAQVLDPENQMVDAVGGGAQLMSDKQHQLRIEHDGKKSVRVSIDGKQTAALADVGRLTSGELMVYVHASTPVLIKRLVIAGVPTPADPQQLRDRYVADVLRGLWP